MSAKACFNCNKPFGLLSTGISISGDDNIALCTKCYSQIGVKMNILINTGMNDSNLLVKSQDAIQEIQNSSLSDETKQVATEYVNTLTEKYQNQNNQQKEQQMHSLQQAEADKKRKLIIKEKTENAWKKAQAEMQQYLENSILYFSLTGVRGRSLKVYDDRVEITTDPTLGALLTNNATDGEKTIFYSDVVGIQYKRQGITVGYLQFETASGQMNNVKSNQFSENTFTFVGNEELMDQIHDFIVYKVSRYKQLPDRRIRKI